MADLLFVRVRNTTIPVNADAGLNYSTAKTNTAPI